MAGKGALEWAMMAVWRGKQDQVQLSISQATLLSTLVSAYDGHGRKQTSGLLRPNGGPPRPSPTCSERQVWICSLADHLDFGFDFDFDFDSDPMTL